VTARIEIFGDKGSAIIENDQLSYLHLARDEASQPGDYGANPKMDENVQAQFIAPIQKEPASVSASQNPAALSATSHALQFADMIRAIRENGTPLVDGNAGRWPVEIILSIYESARTHREVWF